MVIHDIIPLVLYSWSAVTVLWGAYVGGVLSALMNHHATQRRADDCVYLCCIWAGNLIVVLMGFIIPLYLPSLKSSIGDAVIVVNVFYMSFLYVCHMVVTHWKQAITKRGSGCNSYQHSV